ncbi:hypothetical protein EYF80_030914 [Liparis tanakae]|uniref:Uncharacterized protein n=1 Tax=Liparis tanakae TaxID=230148 RepID=A0A4Z2H257_9TELE|nr:hypothetical protein EYF80_030914 [Liparis tanakae]
MMEDGVKLLGHHRDPKGQIFYSIEFHAAILSYPRLKLVQLDEDDEDDEEDEEDEDSFSTAVFLMTFAGVSFRASRSSCVTFCRLGAEARGVMIDAMCPGGGEGTPRGEGRPPSATNEVGEAGGGFG